MIQFCPNCKCDLIENKKLSQGVMECGTCKARFYILETTPPAAARCDIQYDVPGSKYGFCNTCDEVVTGMGESPDCFQHE